MTKLDKTVARETVYICVWELILSVLMQAIYLAVGLWSNKVLFGNLISAYFAVLNFLLMGMTVQNALKMEEKDARHAMRFSQSARMLMLFLAAGTGVYFCDPIASVLPLFFHPAKKIDLIRVLMTNKERLVKRRRAKKR